MLNMILIDINCNKSRKNVNKFVDQKWKEGGLYICYL